METNSASASSGRNYQIDVLKLVCAVLVVISHCYSLVDPQNTDLIEKMLNFGWVSVHIFFVISGFLMIKSIDKKYRNNACTNPGHSAFSYILAKYKAISLPFIVSIVISMSTYLILAIYIYIYMVHS